MLGILRVHLAGQLAHAAGHHLQELSNRPHLAHLAQLVGKIFQRKLAGEQPFGLLLGGLLVKVGLGALDQTEQIAHAQDAGGQAAGIIGF